MSEANRVTAGTVKTTWEVWTYDVWGNARDGYEVNDRCCQNRNLSLTLKVEHYNVGEPSEFTAAAPTDHQLREVFGVRCRLSFDGDDITVYITRDADGYPIGEMTCTSHDSLSPIRAKGVPADPPVAS